MWKLWHFSCQTLVSSLSTPRVKHPSEVTISEQISEWRGPFTCNMYCILSPWWVYVDDISGCRNQLGCSLSVEYHQHTSSLLRDGVTVLVALSGGLVVLTVRQLHAALLLNLQHLQHQYARPVHWRAEQQQHRCWVCVPLCVCVQSVLMLSRTLCGTHYALWE